MSTKMVYQLDADGIYIGPANAYESPLEAGVFHLPAGCVELAPPVLEAKNAAIWTDDGWSLAPDHRGETWYLGDAKAVIDFIGNPGEHGYRTVPQEPTLDDLREAKIGSILEISARLLSAGAPVESGLHIALDDGSRADLTAMAATAIAAASGAVAWPDTYARGWITVENVRIPLATPADGLALAATVGNYYAAIVQHRRDLKDAVLAAADEAALATIDVEAGWPAS